LVHQDHLRGRARPGHDRARFGRRLADRLLPEQPWGSPYYNINTTYTDGAGTAIQNSVTYTQFWASNTNVPLPIVPVIDLQMQNQIIAGFTSGRLTYDPARCT